MSKQWLHEHFTDPYVKQAQESGYRSRAVYKLLEIQQKDHLFKSGMTVIDLGAAPGGWSQVIAPLVAPLGQVIAVDILPMEPIAGVNFIQGDFSSTETLNILLQTLQGKTVDWVVSDMLPNLSGHASVDLPKAMYLAELALDFASDVLPEGQGGLLMKVFQGEGFDHLYDEIKSTFEKVVIRKPKASRSRSREMYILAKRLKRVTKRCFRYD
jgi:23S rRNA (uridine2552-2'-O)-methyltransferase